MLKEPSEITSCVETFGFIGLMSALDTGVTSTDPTPYQTVTGLPKMKDRRSVLGTRILGSLEKLQPADRCRNEVFDECTVGDGKLTIRSSTSGAVLPNNREPDATDIATRRVAIFVHDVDNMDQTGSRHVMENRVLCVSAAHSSSPSTVSRASSILDA
jgi:hypothetical protein